jgi:hypothetical protein
MINTFKNIIFMTFLLGTGFIVLAVGWGGAPFDTAGSAVNDGASALGEAAQGVHDLINNISESITAVADSMQRAGEALWKPIEMLGAILGVSGKTSVEPQQAAITPERAPAQNSEQNSEIVPAETPEMAQAQEPATVQDNATSPAEAVASTSTSTSTPASAKASDSAQKHD